MVIKKVLLCSMIFVVDFKINDFLDIFLIIINCLFKVFSICTDNVVKKKITEFPF